MLVKLSKGMHRAFTLFYKYNSVTVSRYLGRLGSSKSYSVMQNTQSIKAPTFWQCYKSIFRYNGLHQLRNVTTAVGSKGVSKSHKVVGFWLLGCSGMVFVAVALGGITRLTESGLSMVTWKLLGESMPLSKADWLMEFHKYQQFPEYKIKNKELTLEEFKRIWWMEYAHRTWGRLIGAVFLIPAVGFWVRGYFTPAMKRKVVLIGGLIAAQGLMGWYMVKSGLEDRFHGESDVPRVSQYRLAAHLGLAFTLYMILLRAALDQLLPVQAAVVTKSAGKLKLLAHSCKGMVFVTALSGAFVAGLDAGLVYNSFPKMADKWIPDDILALNPKLKNFTDNPTTVQFNHRVLGISTVGLITSTWLVFRNMKLHPRAHVAVTALATMAWFQAVLGLSTLLLYVPTGLAASHQSGSLMLISFAVWLTQELKWIKKIPK